MLRLFRRVKRKVKKTDPTGPKIVPRQQDFMEISASLASNEAYLKQEFANISDIIFRCFYAGEVEILAVWFDGLIDNRVNLDIFRTLMLDITEKQLLEVPAE
jgi:hypothetical protein